DKSKMVGVDIGTYYPVLGKSNTEIAAASRSQHRCQGMGRPLSRGSSMEYLELLKGDLPSSKDNLFAGIDITWSRIKGGAPIQKALEAIDAGFRYDNPSASVPALLAVYRKIKALPDNQWKSIKLEEIKDVIQACLALFMEATVSERTATPGQSVEVELELVNRSPIKAELQSIHFMGAQKDTSLQLNLPENETQKFYQRVQIPKDAPFTSPYWLNKPADLGMYTVDDQSLRGLPETPRFLRVAFDLLIDGEKMRVERDVLYKGSDRVEGETYQPFDILPPVFAGTTDNVYIFANQAPKTVSVKLRAGADAVKGTIELCLPENWEVEPAKQDFSLALKGAEQQIDFKLYPPEEQSVGTILAMAKVDGKTYTNDLISIEYSHIPIQSVLRPGEARVVKVDLHKAGDRIGYIMGAGDEIPASLEQVGYQVDILDDNEITPANLKQYDAVILGIRAYNTVDRMKFHQPILLDYVKEGGTMIVQYNTTWQMEFPMEQIAPYPLKLSRERVTVEEAPVRFLAPDHPVLNEPNKITEHDFDGWVQERGLYFPNEWDPQFQAILSCNDPGETPKDGGLLVAPYGKGYYIYTGYSWFRELPAGVPGAYRLFTNLISLGKKAQP
ncbi:MAG: LmbE family protein, partial [Phaeodactylibacter sp.]|nr:LmbE family protein [Phaeodactylibacter sp.]